MSETSPKEHDYLQSEAEKRNFLQKLDEMADRLDELAARPAESKDVAKVFVGIPAVMVFGTALVTVLGLAPTALSEKYNQFLYKNMTENDKYIKAYYEMLLAYLATDFVIGFKDVRVAERISLGIGDIFNGYTHSKTVESFDDLPISTHILPAMAKTARVLSRAFKKIPTFKS